VFWTRAALTVATVLFLGTGLTAVVLALSSPAREHPIRELSLVGPIADGDAEISGMAWHGDQLVLLPQYPDRYARRDADGVLFVLERQEIEDALESGRALSPVELPLRAPELTMRDGYQGFEAIAFSGDDVYLTVEVDREGAMSGLLLKGTWSPEDGVSLDVEHAIELRPQTPIRNLAYEAMTIRDDKVIVFYEANGAANEAPHALVFDTSLRPVRDVPMDALEYRITDASDADSDGRFWAANYFYPNTRWQVGECALRARFGDGETHSEGGAVERLVEMELGPDGVRLTDRAPMQIALHGEPRNWEGLVRMGDGFLVATDKFPSTILGYVE